eukprot:scaffold322156_cov35-Tisochrysis_lutea.AAC.4
MANKAYVAEAARPWQAVDKQSTSEANSCFTSLYETCRAHWALMIAARKTGESTGTAAFECWAPVSSVPF